MFIVALEFPAFGAHHLQVRVRLFGTDLPDDQGDDQAVNKHVVLSLFICLLNRNEIVQSFDAVEYF